MVQVSRSEGSGRWSGSPVDRLTVGALVTGVLTAASLTRQAATSRWIDTGGNCGFDGVAYCRMAAGELAFPPYSRRPLTPLLVHSLHFGSVLDRFLIVNLLAAAVATVLVFFLTRRLAVGSGMQRANAAAVIAASLVALNPFVWHMAMTYPALTDNLALALGLGWLVVLTGSRPWLSVALAPLTVLCREAWAPPILLALVVCWLVLPALRELWATNAALVIAAGLAALNMPELPGGQTRSFVTVANEQLRDHFTTQQGLSRFLWMSAAGLGFVVLLVVVRRQETRTRSLTAVAVALAGGHIAMAVVGGTDTDRLLVPAFAILTAVALGAVARVRAADPALAVAILASLAVWHPWRIVNPSPAFWLRSFGVHAIPWVEMREELNRGVRRLAIVAVIAGILAIVMLVSRRRSVNGPIRSDDMIVPRSGCS